MLYSYSFNSVVRAHIVHSDFADCLCVLRERAVQEMRRQGMSFSPLQTSLPLSSSGSSHHISPERSILRTLNRSTDKSADRYGFGRENY